VEVSLSHVVLCRVHPVIIASEENTFTLTACLWFYNKRFSFADVELLFEGFQIAWQQPSLGEEVILVSEVLLHAQQVFGEQVFAGDNVHTGEVVCPLVELHLLQ